MIIKGNINVTWTEADYINLPWYTNEVHEEKFNATVDTSTYDVGVSMCFEDLPEVFQTITNQFNLDKPVIAVNKLETGKILPFHKDLFKSYRARNNIAERQPITRIIVFLHKQKAGHQLWIEDTICIGDAGAFFGWTQNTVHMAANLGTENRYILQITGCEKLYVKEPMHPSEGEMSLDSTGEVVVYQLGNWVRNIFP